MTLISNLDLDGNQCQRPGKPKLPSQPAQTPPSGTRPHRFAGALVWHTAQPILSGRSTAVAGHWRAVARDQAGQGEAKGRPWAAHQSGRPAVERGPVARAAPILPGSRVRQTGWAEVAGWAVGGEKVCLASAPKSRAVLRTISMIFILPSCLVQGPRRDFHRSALFQDSGHCERMFDAAASQNSETFLPIAFVRSKRRNEFLHKLVP